MDETRIGRPSDIIGWLQSEKRVIADVVRTTFTSDIVGIGSRSAFSSTSGDVARGFSRFMARYFSSYRRKWPISSTGFCVSFEYNFFFNE